MRLASLPALTFVLTLLTGALVMPGSAVAQTAEPTPTELTYLADTKPFRDRLGAYQVLLAAHQQAADEGQIDGIGRDDLGDLTRELFTARQAFAGAAPSARLDQYDRTVTLALDRAYEATVLLLRAQVTDSMPDRAALIHEAGRQGSSGSRLLQEAADQLRTLLPAVD
jgi:hypothetical protein